MKIFNPEKEINKIRNGNKNKIMLSICTLLLIIAIGSTYALYQVRHSNKLVYTKVSDFSRDIKLAVYVNGDKKETFPTKDEGVVYSGYKCDKKDITTINWNSENWNIELVSNGPDKCNIYFQEGKEFDYTGEIKQYQVPKTGTYKLEVWGAQGGSDYGGKGGYSVGNIKLDKDQVLYIVVGGTGTLSKGGYNGGGNPDTIIIKTDLTTNDGKMIKSTYVTPEGLSFGGGGATHIAKVSGELKSLSSQQEQILIVAGAGGGGGYENIRSRNGTSSTYLEPYVPGGSGGGENGEEGPFPPGNHDQGYPGTQTSAGECPIWKEISDCGGFGYGGDYASLIYGGNGGGGGWYGGSGSDRSHAGGAGGSGHLGTDLIAGTTNMETGIREGNGFARITYLGE